MIDREKRELAAALLRQFRDGQINSDELETAWPAYKEDRALRAVESMVWAFYDDHFPRRMSGKQTATHEEYDALTRYAAFLDTQLPYEWPQSSFYRIGGLGILTILSLGLLWPVDRWIKRRNAQFEAELRAAGDFDVWPFIKREDHDHSPAS